VNEGGTGRFWFSASYDGTAWDALDFMTAEYSQDSLKGIAKTSNGVLWMIGSLSTELWQSVGDADAPWSRVQGSVQEIGCIAPDSIVSNGSQVFWLGSESGYGGVYMGSGYSIQKISTPAIEYQIKSVASIETAVAFAYSDETHSFYVISFSTEKTFVFDLSTGEWHIRGSLNIPTGVNVRQFAQNYCFFNGKHYVGHYNSPVLYEMSLGIYAEAGADIRRVIITGNISIENKLLKHRMLELDCEKGVGLIGENSPQVALKISDDGGRSFSAEEWQEVGAIGDYDITTSWCMLGISRNRAYKFIVSDQVKWIITGLYGELR
jgi:hypothetical protein